MKTDTYRYTGRRLDHKFGLYYYRNRYHAPALGRFISPDPIGYADSLNIDHATGRDWKGPGWDDTNGLDPAFSGAPLKFPVSFKREHATNSTPNPNP